MKERVASLLIWTAWAALAHAQVDVVTEAQVTAGNGNHTPLWLTANKYGLSSLETTNGYLRAAAFRPLTADSSRQWQRSFGADMAVATGFTSTLVVQQLYGELGWKRGLLTLGAKQQPMELKNRELSSGGQTLGVNARPVPGARLELKDYWEIPGMKGWLGLRGHIFYGLQTDDRWQENFTNRESRYTKHTKIHTKAGYLRVGPAQKPFTVELGLEMGCQFGGETYNYNTGSQVIPCVKSESGWRGFFHALIPTGNDTDETDYKNTEGNHVGSLILRANLDYPTWAVSAYADHYFEDHSQVFFFCYDGYGSGNEWNRKVHSKFFVYDLRDAMLGLEVSMKRVPWLNTIVAEYLYTKYQSGPMYHDHTKTMPDQIAGVDNYYNHHIFTGWQHWGQVMGNPLYRSPLYNASHEISMEDNRFWAWHVGVSGNPIGRMHYRVLASWQKGFGTYYRPFVEPKTNMSLLAEASFLFPEKSLLRGWTMKGAVALDRGGLLGDNTGVQLTVGKKICL